MRMLTNILFICNRIIFATYNQASERITVSLKQRPRSIIKDDVAQRRQAHCGWERDKLSGCNQEQWRIPEFMYWTIAKKTFHILLCTLVTICKPFFCNSWRLMYGGDKHSRIWYVESISKYNHLYSVPMTIKLIKSDQNHCAKYHLPTMIYFCPSLLVNCPHHAIR